jgi:hypothetical protein
MKQNNISKAEVQGIFAEGIDSYLEKFPANKQQRKAMYAIVNCRGRAWEDISISVIIADTKRYPITPAETDTVQSVSRANSWNGLIS